ncbi:hypothetical protein MMC28_001454 [Mycoblastus sanguinarius]|nr:hypothetical protein [Mycoblastus sanguinarius]
MARQVISKLTAAYQRTSRIFQFPVESSESNIGLQESRRISDPSPYFDDPAQEPSQHQPQYHDDPTREGLQPQQYISPVTGEPSPLKVQSTSLGGDLQPVGNWMRVNVSGHPPQIFRLSAWVTGEGHHYTNLSYRFLAWLAAVIKALLLSPIYTIIIWNYVRADVRSYLAFHKDYTRPRQIPHEYPRFLGRCLEYPKHARNNLDVSLANIHPHPSNENNHLVPIYTAKEQKRLHRPRKLFVKNHDSWLEMDSDSLQAEKPYIFISYAANQFQRSKDPSGRLVLTEGALQRIKERATALTEQNGLDAYWIDFLRAPDQPEATDDVHRFCDIVRGSELVCVLLAEDKDMANSLAMFGKRLWCLPECLLAPRHMIYVQGGGKSEMISIMQLPARAWTNSYINDSGHLVKGKGKEEEFHLLAEHFSGLLVLSRLQLFSVALSAMRALDFFPFQNGDIAYALMGLLCKRPAMDPTDSEKQALARVCLSNDSDRLLERIVCVQPSKDKGYSGWLTINDSFGVNLWDIEPRCQVVGICNDEAIIIDGCHGISIDWESIPRIQFETKMTTIQKLILSIIWSSSGWMYFSLSSIILLTFTRTYMSVTDVDPHFVWPFFYYFWLGFKVTTTLYLSLSFIVPFWMRWIYGGQLVEISPHLIGIEGTMPIDQLERMALGTVAGHGRLQYSASSGILCSRNSQTRTGVSPTIDPESLPAGHRVFTLLDTASTQRSNLNCQTDSS